MIKRSITKLSIKCIDTLNKWKNKTNIKMRKNTSRSYFTKQKRYTAMMFHYLSKLLKIFYCS